MFEIPLYIILKEKKSIERCLKSQIYYKKKYKYKRNLKRLPHLKKLYIKKMFDKCEERCDARERKEEKKVQEKSYIITPFTEDKKL